MSRYQIAQAIGVSESTLARPYNGERLPTLELVCRVAGVVGYEIAVTAKKRRRRRENA
jgi:transcriptional regulator with XRE-family HTH domain